MTLQEFVQRHILGGSAHAGGGAPGAAAAAAEGQPQGAATAAAPSAARRGYLAQHPLFDQIPALAADIREPPYCVLGEGEVQSINAWFGPAGTVRGGRRERRGCGIGSQAPRCALCCARCPGPALLTPRRPAVQVTPLHTDPHANLLCQAAGRKYVRLYAPAATPAMYPHAEGMHTNTGQVDVDAPNQQQHPLFAAAPFQGTRRGRDSAQQPVLPLLGAGQRALPHVPTEAPRTAHTCPALLQTACWRQGRCCSSRLAGGTTCAAPPLPSLSATGGGRRGRWELVGRRARARGGSLSPMAGRRLAGGRAAWESPFILTGMTSSVPTSIVSIEKSCRENWVETVVPLPSAGASGRHTQQHACQSAGQGGHACNWAGQAMHRRLGHDCRQGTRRAM